MTPVGLNSGLTITNETAITKEGSRRLRSDSESHTTSLLDNREHNYRQSSVIVCSLLVRRCTSYVDGARRMTCAVPIRMLRFQIPPEAKLVSRLTNVSLLKLKIFEDRASPPPQAPAQQDPPKSA